jgi:tetratricopeptide (TPR) repeat protein
MSFVMGQLPTANQRGLSRPVIIISGLILSFFIVVTVVGTQLLTSRSVPSPKKIEKLLKNKRYTEAITSLRKGSPAQHQRVSYAVQVAMAWMALAWEEQNKQGWMEYGKNSADWLNSATADSALMYLQEAIFLDPSSVDAHYYLGILYREKGWYNDAEREFLTALKLDKNHIESRINIAVLYTRTNKLIESERQLQLAWKADSKNAAVAKNLLFLYRYHLEIPESAIVWSNRYLNMGPHNDIDEHQIKKDLMDLLVRYPDLPLSEEQKWRKAPRFGRNLSNRQ